MYSPFYDAVYYYMLKDPRDELENSLNVYIMISCSNSKLYLQG